jgi:hypothetical protein
MKNKLRAILGLIALAFISSASAKEKAYPEQDPVLKYDLPSGWSSKDDGDATILQSKSERVIVSFTAVPKDASMAVYKEQLAAEKKRQGWQGVKVIMEPRKDTINGLTFFSGIYEAKGEGVDSKSTFEFTLMLFNGGKGQSILCTLTVDSPKTLSDADKNGYDTLMESMKAYK